MGCGWMPIRFTNGTANCLYGVGMPVERDWAETGGTAITFKISQNVDYIIRP